jgi:creatinine amidohydrolase
MEQTFLIEEMTSGEYRERITGAPAVLLPLGSIEVLGAHGPLGADYLVSRSVPLLVARRTGCLVAPSIAYGDTMELSDWPGTVYVPADVLESYYYAVAKSYLTKGAAKKLVFLNFHSLNHNAANAVCRRLQHEGHRIFLVDWWKTVGQNCADLLEDRQNCNGHGGEMITSVVMAVRADLVKTEQAQNETPHEALKYYAKYLMNSGSPFLAYGDFHDYCDSGAWGNISHSTPEKGAELIRRAVLAISDFLTESTERSL